MALTRVEAQSNKTTVGTVTASSLSGAPMVIGQQPCVNAIDADANNKATVFLDGVFILTVNAVDADGNSAVAEGDILYYSSGDTIKLSKKNTGVRWGYAKAAVTTGTSAKIACQLGY